MKPNVYYDDPQGDGRAWDIATSGAAEGNNYWRATTYNTGSIQKGTMSIIPVKAGGKVTLWPIHDDLER